MILIFLISFFLRVFASEFDPTQHENWSHLPHDKCGFAWKDRIIGGKEAPLKAYPWMVRIGYSVPYLNTSSNSTYFQCSGALITSKLVLTAAHCVYFPNGDLKIESLRLGEHDADTNPDCINSYCTDPVVDVNISEIIVPDTFDLKTHVDDIALIRIKEEVNFTSFIKPICLSSEKKNYVGSVAEVAGWGINNITARTSSNTLLYVQIKVVDIDVCDEHFGDYVTLGSSQMCAGGEVGKDSCAGDSGGPLMIAETGPEGPRYFLLGLVSFGTEKCGVSATPGVYTRISAFLEWILDNLEETVDSSVKIL